MNRNEFILTLKNLKGVGNKIAMTITENFFSDSVDLEKLFSYINDKYPKFNFNLDQVSNANFKAKNTITKCVEKNIFIVNYKDYEYPKKLTELKNQPVILFYKGQIERLNTNPTIAIIGTREPSNYGIEITKKYAKFFVDEGFNIVSGLAEGIDGIGQQSTLDSDGYTVAFIAQGLNTPIYPKSNQELAVKILEKGGALISEYDIDEKPNKFYFVERDRLQSGASDAVLVIETDVVGGTMHAVKSIFELKRKLGVLDHPDKFKLNNSKALGNQMLIADKGANPLFSLESITAFSSEIHDKFYSRSKVVDASVNDSNLSQVKKNDGILENNEITIKNKQSINKKAIAKNQIGFEDDLFDKKKND